MDPPINKGMQNRNIYNTTNNTLYYIHMDPPTKSKARRSRGDVVTSSK